MTRRRLAVNLLRPKGRARAVRPFSRTSGTLGIEGTPMLQIFVFAGAAAVAVFVIVDALAPALQFLAGTVDI